MDKRLLNFSPSPEEPIRFYENEISHLICSRLKPKYIFFKNMGSTLYQKEDFCYYLKSKHAELSHIGKLFGIPTFDKGTVFNREKKKSFFAFKFDSVFADIKTNKFFTENPMIQNDQKFVVNLKKLNLSNQNFCLSN
jgi:hypothetical protein